MAARVAPAWSLLYGLVALAWAGGCAGYPFDVTVDPEARMSILGRVAPQAGAAGLAALSLLGALAGFAMLRGRRGGSVAGRRAALAVGTVLAITFAILLPDLRVLMTMAYAPVLLVLAPFGWPPGVSLGSLVTWPLVHQLVLMAGGLAWAGATIRYRRRATGACDRCGRRPAAAWAPGTGEPETGWIGRWGPRAVAIAVVIPLVYVATRWAWALGVPLGIPVDALRAETGHATYLGGAMLASVAVVGAVLTTGLVRPWGEVVPAWLPLLGGRRIPPGVAIVPASVIAMVITAAGVAFVRLVAVGEMPLHAAEWGIVGPTLLWPLWGAALGVATLAYRERRRGGCRWCGAAATSSTPRARR